MCKGSDYFDWSRKKTAKKCFGWKEMFIFAMQYLRNDRLQAENPMKETQNIEFKRQWRDDFLAELCGFANAQGGTLDIGVDDKGSVVGIENAKQLLEKLPNLINQTMGLLATVNLLAEDGKEYLSISVSASEQPVSYRGKYYYRSGNTLQAMNGSALQTFLLRKMNLSWDAVIQPNATIEDVDR